MQKLTALSSSLAYLNIQAIAIEDLPFEFLLNALRLQEGVSRTLFEARTGLSLSVLASDWSFLVKEGLLQAMDQRLVTTPEGYRHLNAVLSRWLS
jgi:oxygen-independent coproporphyrinogen-3 oxidase